MTLLATAFLILEVLILAVSCFIGYRRGIGRSTVRLVYLIAIGIGSFFLAKAIASAISESVFAIIHPLLPADVLEILPYSPELEPLATNILGALIAPFLFATLFWLLQLLSLIFFKRISKAIVNAVYKEDSPKWSRWAGVAAGLVIGLVISAALLSPLYMVLNVAENIPDRTEVIFSEAYDTNVSPKQPDNALAASPTVQSIQFKPKFNASALSPLDKPLVKLLTTYRIHEQSEGSAHQESLLHSLPLIVEMSADALYAYNSTIYNGGETVDAISNAAANINPYLDESDTIKYVVSDAVHALGTTFREGHSFLGISLPEAEDPFSKSIITHFVDALANTTPENVKDNMLTLFGKPSVDPITGEIAESQASNAGLLTTLSKIDAEDPLASLSSQGDTTAIVSAIAENDNMSGMMDEIHDFATGLIEESGIDLADRQYEEFYTNVKDDISTQIIEHSNKEESTLTDVAKDIESTLDGYLDEHDIRLDDLQVSVVSVSLAKEFSDEKYLNENGELDVSIKDLMNFFGVDESQIPDWAH